MDDDHTFGEVLLFTVLAILGAIFTVSGIPQEEPDLFIIGLCCLLAAPPAYVNWRRIIRNIRRRS